MSSGLAFRVTCTDEAHSGDADQTGDRLKASVKGTWHEQSLCSQGWCVFFADSLQVYLPRKPDAVEWQHGVAVLGQSFAFELYLAIAIHCAPRVNEEAISIARKQGNRQQGHDMVYVYVRSSRSLSAKQPMLILLPVQTQFCSHRRCICAPSDRTERFQECATGHNLSRHTHEGGQQQIPASFLHHGTSLDGFGGGAIEAFLWKCSGVTASTSRDG